MNGKGIVLSGQCRRVISSHLVRVVIRQLVVEIAIENISEVGGVVSKCVQL